MYLFFGINGIGGVMNWYRSCNSINGWTLGIVLDVGLSFEKFFFIESGSYIIVDFSYGS